MKNKTPYIVIMILFIMFNVIAFAIPTPKTSAFWICYAFTVVAFVMQCFIWYLTIGKKHNLKSKMLGLSVIYISTVYLAVQFIVFMVFMFVSSASWWCAILICTLILGISAICIITTNAGTGTIADIDDKIEVKHRFIKNLQTEVEILAESETDNAVKQKLTELAKIIRLSDPISDSSLSELENEISAKIASIKNTEDKISAIKEVEHLFSKRNKKVKELKG